MIKQYILTESEIKSIINNVDIIVSRLDQLEQEGRQVDYGGCLNFKEKFIKILDIINYK